MITVETPQLIDRSVNPESGEVHDWHVQRLKKVQIPSEDGEGFTTDWVPDTDKTSIRYRLSGDSIIQEKEQDIMLGMTQNGEYYFYGEQEAVYAKVYGWWRRFPKVPLRRGGAFSIIMTTMPIRPRCMWTAMTFTSAGFGRNSRMRA